MVAMFVNGSGQNEHSLERTFHRCFLPISLHLAEGFQRRRLKCEKLTDDTRRTPSDGKSSHCLWQGDKYRLYHDIRHPKHEKESKNDIKTLCYIVIIAFY
jgi:hypothetical protein